MGLFRRNRKHQLDSSRALKSPVSTETLQETARHLRQIHFYFMLVCIGLLLAVFLPRDTTLDKAAAQIDELIRFQSEAGDAAIWEIAEMTPPEWTGERGGPYAAIVFRTADDSSDKQNVCFVYENEILPGSYGLLQHEGVSDFRRVESHDEFTQLWNTLNAEDAFLRVKSYWNQAYYREEGSADLNMFERVDVEVRTAPDEVRQLFQQAFSLSSDSTLSPSRAKWVDIEIDTEDEKLMRGIRLHRTFSANDGSNEIILPVEFEPARLPILSRLLACSEGPYEYLNANDYLMVHEELSDWTLSGNLDQLSLYALRDVLNTIRIAQSAKFHVFGLEIPYELLFKYGLLVLIVVQFFFWAHLRSLRLMARGHASAVWVPWLPLYPNRMSRMMSINSIVMFPLSVVFQLVWATGFQLAAVAFAIVGAITASLLLIEFLRLWHGGMSAQREAELPAFRAA